MPGVSPFRRSPSSTLSSHFQILMHPFWSCDHNKLNFQARNKELPHHFRFYKLDTTVDHNCPISSNRQKQNMKKSITSNYLFFKEHIIGKQKAFNANKEDILHINTLMKKVLVGILGKGQRQFKCTLSHGRYIL